MISIATPFNEDFFVFFQEVLKNKSSLINSETVIGMTPLHLAAAFNNQYVLIGLIDIGADVNAR